MLFADFLSTNGWFGCRMSPIGEAEAGSTGVRPAEEYPIGKLIPMRGRDFVPSPPNVVDGIGIDFPDA